MDSRPFVKVGPPSALAMFEAEAEGKTADSCIEEILGFFIEARDSAAERPSE